MLDSSEWMTRSARDIFAIRLAIRGKFGALLKGLVRCVCCDVAMTPNHKTKAGIKRYRYYV